MKSDWFSTSTYAGKFDPSVCEEMSRLIPSVFEKGSVLFRPGDQTSGFILVLSGRVGVFLTGKNGREILLYSVEPGETCIQTTFGLLGERDYTGEAVAETDVTAVMIPKPAFQQFVARSDRFREFVFSAFADRMADITRLLEQVAFTSVDERLALVLLERCRDSGFVETTHQELATAIGSSREVVSRRLERLQARGFVELERGIVRIADKKELADLANG